MFRGLVSKNHALLISVCCGSVVITANDFESGHPGSNPELGPICYKVSITTQGLPEPASSGVVGYIGYQTVA